MKKAAIFLIMAVLVVGTLFFSGCVLPGTGTSDNNLKITNDADAQKALNDIGTDISGINNSLSEMDENLSK